MYGGGENFKVVITECAAIRGEPTIERKILSKIDADVCLLRTKDETKIMEATKDADVVLCDAAPITQMIIQNFVRARGIVEMGIGHDNIDVEAATTRGIYVCNVPDYCLPEVADHALGLILALARKIPWINSLTKAGEWNWNKFRPILNLEGRTAGIIGFGKIGGRVAERLKSLEVKIFVYDPYIPESLVKQRGSKPVDLKTLLEKSDIVTIHVPLIKDTYHLIGEKELQLMKKTAILINTARGAVVDQRALYEALRTRRIGYAGLDVLEKEPPDPDDPLLRLPNVIVTPHMAFYSERSARVLRKEAVEEVIRILEGKKPKNLVNPEVLKHSRHI